jgi:hypothetical protein
MGLSFTIAVGLRQRIHSEVRVPQDSWPHFTVSDSRLPQPPPAGGPVCIPWRINSRLTKYKTSPPTGPPLFEFVFVAAQAWTGRVESHVTTDGQSASPPGTKHPSGAHCQTVAGPPRRRVRRPRPLPVLASAVNLGSESHHTTPSQIRDFPLRRLPRLAGPRLRHSIQPPHGLLQLSSLLTLYTDRVENTVSNSIFIVVCVSVAAGTCLQSCCLETNDISESFASNGCFSGSKVLALSKYGTM